MKAVIDSSIIADFAKSKSTGIVIRSYEKRGSYLCYALISHTIFFPDIKERLIGFVLFLDQIIVI